MVWGICSQISVRIGSHLRQCDFHVVEVTKSILIVSHLCEHGIETYLARQLFLKYGEGHEPLIKKSDMYFVKAQIVREVKGAVEAAAHAYKQKIHKRHAYELLIHKRHAYELNSQISSGSSKRDCVIVQPVAEDTVDDERILVEAGAEQIPTPCEPSELEKMNHELTHIPI